MDGEADIQVWLESYTNRQPSVVVPYVKTTKDITLRYQVNTVNEGAAGKSVITQAGTIQANAHLQTELVRFTINNKIDDKCQIKITLTEPGKIAKLYQFKCPS